MWRYTSIWDVYNIIKANVFSTFIIMLYIYFSLGFGVISRTLFIVDLLVCTALIGTSRVGIRIFFGEVYSLVSNKSLNNNSKRIVIVGRLSRSRGSS